MVVVSLGSLAVVSVIGFCAMFLEGVKKEHHHR